MNKNKLKWQLRKRKIKKKSRKNRKNRRKGINKQEKEEKYLNLQNPSKKPKVKLVKINKYKAYSKMYQKRPFLKRVASKWNKLTNSKKKRKGKSELK